MRHRTARALRGKYKSQLSGYQHIRTIPSESHTNYTSPDDEDEELEDVVTKESIQEEIQDQLIYESKLIPRSSSASSNSPSVSPTEPRTFAEAAMATRPSRRRRNSEKDNNGLDVTLSGPMSLESLGPFKYTFKKKKNSKLSKYTLMGRREREVRGESNANMRIGIDTGVGLGAAGMSMHLKEPTSGVATNPEMGGTSISPHSVRTQDISRRATHLWAKLSKYSSVSYSSSNPPNLTLVDSGIDLSSAVATAASKSLDILDCDVSDSQSVKDRSEAAMTRLVNSTAVQPTKLSLNDMIINDGFDSVQWDPDLPVRSTNNSPEPLSTDPQPVAYTTVGSRVNLNAQPQIAAPNRIQREGSIRRPPLDPVHSRQSNYYNHQRGPPPPLSMSNSMHYAQQLGQSPGSFITPPPSSARSLRSSRSVQRLSQSEQEAQALLRLQGMVSARPSGGFSVTPVTPTPASSNQHSSFLGDDKDMGRAYEAQGPIQGLEKMQTLQRLSRFDNPMQASALRRLSEFSTRTNGEGISNMSSGMDDPNRGHLADLAALLTRAIDFPSVENASMATKGELDRGYTFPPPGLTTTASNPLYGSYSGSTRPTREPMSARVPSGYPQPLTAGPPGQRSYASARQNTNYIDDAWVQEQSTQIQNSHANLNPTSPWQASKTFVEQYTAPAPAPAHTSNIPTSMHTSDSLPLNEIAKYYPNGFPNNMTGNYTRLSLEAQRQVGLLPPETPEQAQARKQKEMDDWFYAGQRRWNMTTEDHVKDIERRAPNPFGPIGPPPKSSSSDNRPLPGITIQEMNKKTIPDVIAPMLDATFGNLLALSAESKESGSRYNRKYAKSPEWHIDASERGNDSFFGEDWGIPTERNGWN
ncbi:Pyrimidine-specific ribonucleoside hydrolase protein [Rutstroemia sp. NJR-2017a BBW]|nr:Pyrimidine-specific ribonucleoside hydrolase protein [Rutstroemia sp. NJR-2017a BBW]